MNIKKFIENVLEHGSGVHSLNIELPSDLRVRQWGLGRMSGAFKTMKTGDARRIFLTEFVKDFISDRQLELSDTMIVITADIDDNGVLTLDLGEIV